jgi:hypothetical protein
MTNGPLVANVRRPIAQDRLGPFSVSVFGKFFLGQVPAVEAMQPADPRRSIIIDPTVFHAPDSSRIAGADIQLSQKQTSNLSRAEANIQLSEADIQLSQKQASNFRGAERGRTDSATRIPRNQPESSHSGI